MTDLQKTAAGGGELPRPVTTRAASDESASAQIQIAVERFVELHSCGDAPELAAFVTTYPEHLRPRILAQCSEFLAFDGLLGPEVWEPSQASADAGEQPSEGRRFGDFDITDELGRGGMGVVYLARQRSLNRRVALKVMASGLTLSSRHVERFRREAAATAQLRHPAIVPVHSLEEVDGTFAIAMDYIAGRNLADIIDDLRLANGSEPGPVEGSLGLAPEKGYVAECAMLCAQISSALSAAHAQGVMHRDLKPRNLMIDDRQKARLLDFGLSKTLGDGSLSMSGEITGTVHYMSPEQTLAKRVEVDHRTDVFALGVILYELLTLHRPFDGKNMQQIVYEICFKEPTSPQKRNPKVPRDLVTVCLKALEKDPSNRYANAAEFEADLLRFLRWEPVHARPAGALSRLGKFVRRHRTEVIAATIVVVLGAGGLGYAGYTAMLDDAEADRLMLAAEGFDAAGDFDRALASATQALALRNDDAVHAAIQRYRNHSELAAKQEEVDIAEARGLISASKQEMTNDRRTAVLLALAAVDRRESAETHSAVLDALGSGSRTQYLEWPHGEVRESRSLVARWSPDGRSILTAAMDTGEPDDAKAILWDLDGKPRCTLSGHQHWIVAAAFLPDGKRVATASVDRTVRLWHVADGSTAGIWRLDGAARQIDFDRRGRRALVTGRSDEHMFAEVRDVESGERLASCAGLTQFVRAAAIAPNGEYSVTYGNADHVKLWSATNGTELARLQDHSGRVTALAFHPDSDAVAVASADGCARIYTVPDGHRIATAHHSREVTTLQFDRAGDRLLTGGKDQTARVWRIDRGAAGAPWQLHEEQTFVGHDDAVTSARFDPTERFVVTGCTDGRLSVFDASGDRSSTGMTLASYDFAGRIYAAQFSPEEGAGRVLAMSGRQPVMWQFAEGLGVVSLRQTGRVPAVRFDATGERVVTAGDDEHLRLWHAREGRLLWISEALGNPITALDVDGAGERIVAATVGGGVHIHRLKDGFGIQQLEPHAQKIRRVQFSASGTRILTADADGRVVVWNANDFSRVSEFDLGAPLAAAALSGGATVLATIGEDANVAQLWRVSSREPIGEIRGDARLVDVAFRPDGKALLTADAAGILRITDLQGEELQRIATDPGLHHVTWSRDGTRIQTNDRIRSRLWDVQTGRQILHFDAQRGAVECSAFSPDGRWAATSCGDGTTHVWPTDPVEVARQLELPPLDPAERRRFGLENPRD